ncbi:MAG: cytosine-specific methyltransferase [Bacteroidetes bacterium]|nr:cytosine-specific methyltransferase [Bacteroidota bacterium]
MKSKYTYIDLFAGCGGLSLGLHNAGWRGLFAIEKSPDAFLTLQYNLIKKIHHFNWPTWLPQQALEINHVLEQYSDLLKNLRGKVDLVAGGPPCQGFSMAGRRKEDDHRNQLVNSYIQFIRLVKPKILFFENVKGFTLEFKKNKDKGKEYASFVEKALDEAGYYVQGKLVNFGEYGIPQKRTRFILVGVRKDLKHSSQDLADSFFQRIENNKHSFLEDKNLSVNTNLNDAISDLLKKNGVTTCPDASKFFSGFYATPSSEYQKLMRKETDEEIPDSHRFAVHRPDIEQKFMDIIQTSTKKNVDIDKTLRERYNIKKHTVIPLDKQLKAPTITTLPDDYIHYSEPRILTVREYARIQSFPDWYKFRGKYTTGGKLRTQEVPRYSQIGNAIPPLFAEQAGVILNQIING